MGKRYVIQLVESIVAAAWEWPLVVRTKLREADELGKLLGREGPLVHNELWMGPPYLGLVLADDGGSSHGGKRQGLERELIYQLQYTSYVGVYIVHITTGQGKQFQRG